MNKHYFYREDTNSRTLYICGPPGVGKTATLNHVLGLPEIKDHAQINVFNGMHYKDTKEFLTRLDQTLCKLAKKSHCPSNSIAALICNIQDCLKKLDTYRYFWEIIRKKELL